MPIYRYCCCRFANKRADKDPEDALAQKFSDAIYEKAIVVKLTLESPQELYSCQKCDNLFIRYYGQVSPHPGRWHQL